MAREYIEDKEEAKPLLERINYYYTPNTEQLMGTINALSPVMQEKKPRILVLDGAIGGKLLKDFNDIIEDPFDLWLMSDDMKII